MLKMCNNAEELESDKWLSELEETSWLNHIKTMLNGANMLIKPVRAGSSALIHCSDGWDRTSQLSCLAQLILDKHYRTIIGFEQLIEKDFIFMGHQFKKRLGHSEKGSTSES